MWLRRRLGELLTGLTQLRKTYHKLFALFLKSQVIQCFQYRNIVPAFILKETNVQTDLVCCQT